MATIKKIGDEYYLCRRKKGLYRGKLIKQNKWCNTFRIKAGHYDSGVISISHNVTCPKELLGKKIMLKVVVVEDKKRFDVDDLEGIYT